MVFRFIPAALAVMMTAAALTGQSPSMSGAVSGYVYDIASRSVRPIVGAPGSSYVGTPILTDVDRAFIAPDGKSALAIENGKVILVRALAGSRTKYVLPSLSSDLDLVAWTSNSSGLVTYSSSARVLRWFDLSVQSPVPGRQVDLSYLEGDVAALATNSDSGQTVIALKHPTRGGFYALVDGAPAWQLIATSDPGDLLFANSSNLLYAIDRSSRQVIQFSDGVKGGHEILSFSGEPAPMADPVGLALSKDGQRLYMAGGVDRTIRAYDVQSRQFAAEISLAVTPSGLLPLGEAGAVLILGPRASSHEPLWLLDVHSVPSVFFVPAASEIRHRIIWSGE